MLTSYLYRLGFEISPVILVNGIAQNITGGMLPIVALTQSTSFVTGLVSGANNLTDLDQYFCHWRPMAGGQLYNWDVAHYPFANQQVAANAMVKQPLKVALSMQCPVNKNNGVLTKLVTLSAMQSVLEAHANLGGTYIVATPANIYNNCLLLQVRDMTGATSPWPQSEWAFEFEAPLISEIQAEAATNSFLSKIDGGSAMSTPSWTNTVAALGNTSLGGAVSSLGNQISSLVGQLTDTFA